ncbi:MAG: hydrogenase formation protein HypD [Phycisphaerae bacterium]|jgi:hydrogenase expression/formation protein HypD
MTSPRIETLVGEVADACSRTERVQIMEVCGTHTMSIFRHGLRSLLPQNLRLVSGPGCPVCVTAQRHVDAAVELAGRADVTIATYGDMMRVPGRSGSLEQSRAQGSQVRVVSSARSALKLARERPDRNVVFLAIGFETTAPATAATVLEADQTGVENFRVLMCHKLIVPAMLALVARGDVALDGFLCPGHVSVIIGADAYGAIAERFGKPCVVAGFEARQILAGVARLVRLISEGRSAVENVYSGVVSAEGNGVARKMLDRVFVRRDAPWRALGVIPDSGFELAATYRRFDALEAFGVELGDDVDDPACRCGEVIVGKVEPSACTLFGEACTPLHPVGPCMVSSEGTCAAWYKYNRGRGTTTGQRGVSF